MVIFSAFKALIFIPLFFFFGYQFQAAGAPYLILAILVYIIYNSAKVAAQSFPIKAIILFPLLFYFGYKFSATGSFMYVVWGVVAFLVYLIIKAMSPD